MCSVKDVKIENGAWEKLSLTLTWKRVKLFGGALFAERWAESAIGKDLFGIVQPRYSRIDDIGCQYERPIKRTVKRIFLRHNIPIDLGGDDKLERAKGRRVLHLHDLHGCA